MTKIQVTAERKKKKKKKKVEKRLTKLKLCNQINIMLINRVP